MSAAGDIANRASKGISEGTPDLQGAVKTGSELALRMEQAKQNRAKLEQQKQEFELKKIESFATQIFKMDKMKDPKSQQVFQNNYLPKIAAASGMEYDKGQISFLTTPENRAKLSYLKGLAEKGEIGPKVILDIMRDPEGTLPEVGLPAAFAAGLSIGKVGESIGEGTSKFLGRQSQERAGGFREDKEKQRQKEAFDKVAREGSKRVATAFKPIKDAKDGVRIGRTSLETLLADHKAGKPLNENLFNTAARGIAKAFNKGAMTEQDVADFKELQGFIGKSEALIRKWVVGGVNIDVVKNLMKVTDITSKILDRRAGETAKEMEGSFTTTAFPGREAELRKASGIDKALAPTLGKKAPNKTEILKGKSAADFKQLSVSAQEAVAKRLNMTIDEVMKALENR